MKTTINCLCAVCRHSFILSFFFFGLSFESTKTSAEIFNSVVLIDDLNFFTSSPQSDEQHDLNKKKLLFFLQKRLFVDPKMKLKLRSSLRGTMGKGVVTNQIALRRPAPTAATKSGLAYSKPDVYPRRTAAA